VHPVCTIEPGPNAKYVPHSLNIGLPGNDPYFPDGLWAAVDADEYAELPDNWIEDTGPFFQYRLGISVAAHNGTTREQRHRRAVQLRAPADARIQNINGQVGHGGATWYSDGTSDGNTETTYYWTYCDNSDVPTVTTYGEPPQLSLRLDNPRRKAMQLAATPYQIDANTDYTLTLLSDIFGDITTNASVTLRCDARYRGRCHHRRLARRTSR